MAQDYPPNCGVCATERARSSLFGMGQSLLFQELHAQTWPPPYAARLLYSDEPLPHPWYGGERALSETRREANGFVTQTPERRVIWTDKGKRYRAQVRAAKLPYHYRLADFPRFVDAKPRAPRARAASARAAQKRSPPTSLAPRATNLGKRSRRRPIAKAASRKKSTPTPKAPMSTSKKSRRKKSTRAAVRVTRTKETVRVTVRYPKTRAKHTTSKRKRSSTSKRKRNANGQFVEGS